MYDRIYHNIIGCSLHEARVQGYREALKMYASKEVLKSSYGTDFRPEHKSQVSKGRSSEARI